MAGWPVSCLPAAALSHRLLPNLAGRVRLQVTKLLFCSLPKSLWETRILSACSVPCSAPSLPFFSVFAGRRNQKKRGGDMLQLANIMS